MNGKFVEDEKINPKKSNRTDSELLPISNGGQLVLDLKNNSGYYLPPTGKDNIPTWWNEFVSGINDTTWNLVSTLISDVAYLNGGNINVNNSKRHLIGVGEADNTTDRTTDFVTFESGNDFNLSDPFPVNAGNLNSGGNIYLTTSIDMGKYSLVKGTYYFPATGNNRPYQKSIQKRLTIA